MIKMKFYLKISLTTFLAGTGKTNGIYLSALTVMVAMILAGCKKDDDGTKNFPVNETFATELIGKGIPADIARFYAAARMESSTPNDTICIYLQTFPNGATREITLLVSPNRRYTPTAEEIANIAPGSAPIYDFKYASRVQADSTTQIDIKYYVANTGLLQGEVFNQLAEGNVENDGFGISWGEIAKTGADVGIGSLIDYAKDNGIRVGPLGSVYALASALSNVTGALDLSRQNSSWLAELNALENCAANPTNPVSRSDPNYSPAAVAKIQASRRELQEVNAVRYLNIMTETGAGITPVTAVLSIGLKQGFVWSEQTLNDYSENTIMREARLTVVPCSDSGELEGNVDVVWECTDSTPTQINHEVWHTQTSVRWVPGITSNQYIAQGSFTFEYTATATAGGITCTDKKNAAGSISGTGSLIIINDPAAQNLLGYAYYAGGGVSIDVAATYSCTGYATIESRTIEWLPLVKGFPGTGGSYEGEMTNPSCTGNSSKGTEKVKWSFSVPPLK